MPADLPSTVPMPWIHPSTAITRLAPDDGEIAIFVRVETRDRSGIREENMTIFLNRIETLPKGIVELTGYEHMSTTTVDQIIRRNGHPPKTGPGAKKIVKKGNVTIS